MLRKFVAHCNHPICSSSRIGSSQPTLLRHISCMRIFDYKVKGPSKPSGSKIDIMIFKNSRFVGFLAPVSSCCRILLKPTLKLKKSVRLFQKSPKTRSPPRSLSEFFSFCFLSIVFSIEIKAQSSLLAHECIIKFACLFMKITS